jgi:hypothetical protein
VSNQDGPDIPREGDFAGAHKTIGHFARALSAHLPRRLAQLREIGRATRAIGKGKPPRR